MHLLIRLTKNPDTRLSVISVQFSLFFIIAAFATLFALTSASAGTILAVSYGNGRIALSWPPVPSFYTEGGWKLVDMGSGTVVARWTPDSLDQELATFPTQKQKTLRSLFATLQSTSDNEKNSIIGLLRIGGLADFKAAVKLGMGCILEGVPKGKRAYHLILTTRDGKSLKQNIASPPIDGWSTTPSPKRVEHLRGESDQKGLKLYWQMPKDQSLFTPFVLVTRSGKELQKTNLTPSPIWVASDDELSEASFVDKEAPLEVEILYTVRLQDIFGRLSEPASIKVFNADLEALRPPGSIKVKAGVNRAKLSWEGGGNPYTAGYVVERSRRTSGIYTVLTKTGLPSTKHGFLDKTVRGGFTYHYRLRSVGPRGHVGPPSDPVTVKPEIDGHPEAPNSLKAEATPTRIRLSWTPQTLPVAGYIIERKKPDDDTWKRLNADLITMPQFDDPLNLNDFGTHRYRVTSVAFGNNQSDPGKPVSVDLIGHPAVPAPFLGDVHWAEGKVELTFQASNPQERTETLLLIRGNSLKDRGMLIKTDINGSATAFEDRFVKTGEDYWYALIAVDKDGYRSVMGNKLGIVTGSSSIPQPQKPDVTFSRKPFRRVIISFAQPEGDLRIAVMRKIGAGPWVTVARDVRDVGQIVDADPPLEGSVEYRIAYVDENSLWSTPSASTTVTLDK